VKLRHMRDMRGARCVLTTIIGVTIAAAVAIAEPSDLAKLASDPQSFLDKEVELSGFCVKGGLEGDVLGYECRTDGTIYVNATDMEPASAKEKLDGCKGEKPDESCRATIRFVPHSFTTSNVLEADKSITIFNTKKAALSF
jgi:hypothetical protein